MNALRKGEMICLSISVWKLRYEKVTQKLNFARQNNFAYFN